MSASVSAVKSLSISLSTSPSLLDGRSKISDRIVSCSGQLNLNQNKPTVVREHVRPLLNTMKMRTERGQNGLLAE